MPSGVESTRTLAGASAFLDNALVRPVGIADTLLVSEDVPISNFCLGGGTVTLVGHFLDCRVDVA